MSEFKKMAKKFYKDWYTGGPYEVVQGTRSGFSDLDYITGGFRSGELIMVASRPVMGKTSFVLNMVDNISVRRNGRTLYLTNDCSEQVISNRVIQIHAGVSGICFSKFEFYDEEEMALNAEEHSLTNANIDIRNITGVATSELEDIVRSRSQGHPLDLLVIDDFKTLKEADNCSDYFVFTELKRLAKKYHVPVIILCPLSRNIEKREDHHPIIADVEIKDAIRISDFVFFLYRENYYEPTEEATVPMEISIVKNPRGVRGVVALKTYRDCFTMSDYPGDKLLDMRKKFEDKCFCNIFDQWQDIISSVEFSLANRKEYNDYIKPLELQTVGGKPMTLTVIIPEEVSEKLYEDKYKGVLIKAVQDVSDQKCEDIFFVTQSEMEDYYAECEKRDRGWS